MARAPSKENERHGGAERFTPDGLIVTRTLGAMMLPRTMPTEPSSTPTFPTGYGSCPVYLLGVMRMSEKRYVDATESAKLIRRELAATYPGVRFAVRTSKYSGGASVTVSWADGPTAEAVQQIADAYTGATFDGMQDLKEYHDSDLGGERVAFMCDFAFTQRELSPEFLSVVTADISAKYGMDAPAVMVSASGSAYLDPNDYRQIPGDADYFTRRILREAHHIAR